MGRSDRAAGMGLQKFRRPAPPADYMRYKARHYGVRHIHKTLEGCLKELKNLM